MKRTESFLLKSPQDILRQLVRDVCEAVDSPRALAVWLMFSNNEHDQMLELSLDPQDYTNSQEFADDYLVTQFLSKYTGLVLSVDPKAQALEAFRHGEAVCKDTNQHLMSRLQSKDRVARIFWSASEKCKRWLTPLSDPLPSGRTPVEESFWNLRWGPGVTSSVKGRALAAYNKFRGNLETTADLYTVGAHYVVNSIPMWATFHGSGIPDNPSSVTPNNFTIVPGNTVTTVPKNAKTERPIAVEPHVNAFLQRGIGITIRDILKRKGIDLRSQERNQHLAKLGSRDGHLATIDLKGASDSISKLVVELLIPPDWLSLLKSCRSPMFQLEKGKWERYHKFSSMGNGYTFELETLIFATLAYATLDELGISARDVSVYGDDIIIPVEAYDLYVEVLNACGFTVNPKKSFRAGPFRESCGEDYFGGVNVRPFFIRSELRSLEAIYTMANNLRRYSALRNNGMGCDRRFLSAWKGLYLSVKPNCRNRIPEGYGDGGFVSELDESLPSISYSGSGPYGPVWQTRVWEFTPITRAKVNATISVASALYEMEQLSSGLETRRAPSPHSSSDRTAYSLRESGSWRFRVRKIYSWPYCGGWV